MAACRSELCHTDDAAPGPACAARGLAGARSRRNRTGKASKIRSEVATDRDTHDFDGMDPIDRMAAQLGRLPVAQRDPELVKACTSVILPKWQHRLPGPAWKKVSKRVVKEINETSSVVRWVQSVVDECATAEHPATIVDLCSGFGILSMLLSEVLPPHLVERIVLVDKMFPCSNAAPSVTDPKVAPQPDSAKTDAPLVDGGPSVDGGAAEKVATAAAKPAAADALHDDSHISTEHLTTAGWPIKLGIRKVNIKKGRERRQLDKYVFARAQGPVIVLAVHLCKALSVHAVTLYNENVTVRAFALKPCCLPGKQMARAKIPIVWNFSNGYTFGPADLYREPLNTASPSTHDKLDGGDAPPPFEEDGLNHTEPFEMPIPETSFGNDDSADSIPALHGCCGHTGHVGEGDTAPLSNVRFSAWVQHLLNGCVGAGSPEKRVVDVEVQKYYFQNKIVLCRRDDTSLCN